MPTSFSRFARHIAALAGIANGSTGSATAPDPNPRGPVIVATPQTTVTQWVPPRHRVMVPRSDDGGE